jgi:hypothetical protein
MLILKTSNRTIELKAKARFYREFKAALGCANLKQAFFSAYENVDVDFLVKFLYSFAVDRPISEDVALDFLDDYLAENHTINELYAECAEFLNGMGFFGKLDLSEGESAIAYFDDKTNKLNMDDKLVNALDNGISDVVNRMVRDRLAEEAKKE